MRTHDQSSPVDPAAAGSWTRAEIAWAAGLTLLAFALRAPQLSASFYGDETFTLFRDTEQLITPTEDKFRFLFFTLFYSWKQLGFHGEVGLRALPLLFGILQIPVAFALGRLLGGFRAALTFAALVAVSPLLIEFSLELRMYSLVPLIALLQAFALQSVQQRAEHRARTLLPWLGFVLAGAAGVYTHFHYWFLNAAFGVALLRRRNAIPFKQSLAALGALGLLYLPNVPNVLRFQAEAGGAPHLVTTDLPGALPKLLAAFTLGFNYFALPSMGMDRAIGGSVVTQNAPLAVVALLPVLVTGFYLIRLHRRRQLDPMLWMAHELFTVPVLLSFSAVLLTGRNFIHPKYMVFCAPFLLLFYAAGFLAIPPRFVRWATALAAGVTFAIAFVHFNQPQLYGRREDMRGLAELLRPALKDDSRVLWLSNRSEATPMKRHPRTDSIWEYYAADLYPWVHLVGLPKPDATPEEVAPVVASLVEGKSDIFFVWQEVGRNVDDPRDLILSDLTKRFGAGERTQLNPRLVVYHWKR